MLELREGVLYRGLVSCDRRLRWLQVIPPVEFWEGVMHRAHCEAAGHERAKNARKGASKSVSERLAG